MGQFADINGDGKQDYVVPWNSNGKRALATFLAKSDGTFNEFVNTVSLNGSFLADKTGRDIGAFADINGDGRKDYVVVWNANGKRAIATYLAKPDGTFNEFVNTVFTNGTFVADTIGRDLGQFADINGDGKQDYVVPWNANGKTALATFLATGDQEKVITDLQTLRLETVHLTLQAEKDPSKVQNYLQDSSNVFNVRDKRLTSSTKSLPTIDGTFDVKYNPPSGYSVNNNNFNFKLGDFNGDGKTDLIHFVNVGNGYVHVWNSKGDGIFDVKSAFTPAPGYGVNANNFNFQTGDFNGDGKTDLIHFVNNGNGYVHVWNSKGDGTFDLKAAFTPAPGYGVNANNFNFQTGDFNGDGKTDLIHFVNNGNGYVHVWNSKGDGTFDLKAAFTPAPNYSVSNNNFNFQTGDFNGDGKTDLIHFVNDGKKGFVTVWNSKGDGTFDVKAPFTPSPNYDVSNNNFNFKLGDFNGDRKTDLIHFVNDGKKGYVHVWLSKGDGTFDLKSAFTPNPSYDVTNNNFNFKLGDFDGDGKTDLIHLINGGNGYVNVWNSKGDGTFDVTPAFSPNPSYDVTNNNFNFKLGDFDGDGKTDLTHFVNGGNGYVNVWNSNGDSTATIKKEANDALQDLRNKYFPELNQANTLTNLQTQVNKEVDQSQQQFASLQASITQKQAQAAAANSQAIWYDQEAALHYQISHKSGATWTEERKEKSRSGGSKTIVVTHVDHDWIIYDAYTQQAASLREQAVKLLKGAEADTTQQNTVSEILKQWQATSSIANQAATTQDQLIALLNQDQAKLQLNGDKQQQIADWQKLLSVLQPQLDQAVKTAESDKAQVAKNWTDYTLSQQAEQKALADLTPKRIDLEAQGQQLLQEINETKQWVTQQSNLLQDEIDQSEALVTQLKTQREAIVKQLVSATGHNKNTLLSLQTLLDQNINLLGQKEAVLIAQQTSFVQKQTLLSTQKQLVS